MLDNITYFAGNPSAWHALIAWSKFSLTSHRMVSSLMRQGIIPKTVIDVGANVGQFTVACAKMFPGASIHSFEPLPGCVRQLQRNVGGLDGVRVYPLALGEASGEVTMHVNSHSQSSSVLALGKRHRSAFPDAREIDAIKVNMSTLDLAMRPIPLEHPVLLKLDVQGYEAQVLQGAAETLDRVDYVLLETSFRPLYEGEKTFSEIARSMEQRGFEFLRPVGWLSEPHNGEVLQMDALFAKSGRRS
jgi:FkbM family methyltransferase